MSYSKKEQYMVNLGNFAKIWGMPTQLNHPGNLLFCEVQPCLPLLEPRLKLECFFFFLAVGEERRRTDNRKSKLNFYNKTWMLF